MAQSTKKSTTDAKKTNKKTTKKSWVSRLKRPRTIIAAAVVLVVLIASGTAYALWYQQPERVVMDAMQDMMSAEQLQTDTTITSDSELVSGPVNVVVTSLKITSQGSLADAIGSMDATAVAEINGREYTVGGKARLTDDKNVYFQLQDVEETITSLREDFGAASMPEQSLAQLEALDDTWVKVTPDDMGENGESFACAVDAVKKLVADDEYDDTIEQLYRDNQFMVVDESVQSKDGNLGYRVTLEEDVYKTYVEQFAASDVAKRHNTCENNASLEDVEEQANDIANQEDAPKVDLTVWVSRFGHELQKVEYTITAKNQSGDDVTFRGTTSVSDDDVSVDVPDGAVDFDDWTESLSMPYSSGMNASSSVRPL